jgi:hypothetical protein
MPSNDIQTPAEFQFYVEQHGIRKTQREFERDSIPGLQKSLSKAHDNLHRQVGINTRLYTSLNKAQKQLGWSKIWIGILGAAVTAEFAIIGWMFEAFLHRMH